MLQKQHGEFQNMCTKSSQIIWEVLVKNNTMGDYSPTKEDYEAFVSTFKVDPLSKMCLDYQVSEGFFKWIQEKRDQLRSEHLRNTYVPDDDEDYEDPSPKLPPTRNPNRTPKESGPLEPGERVCRLLNWKMPEYHKTFAPFHDVDHYISCNKFTPEKEAMVRAMYTAPPHESFIKPKIKYDVPDDPLHVFVNMKIGKSGVKIKITVPMEPVIEYQKKAKLAPLAVRVKAFKNFGYPDSVVLKMIEHDDKMNKQRPELDKWFNKVFGEYDTKKVSKPKAKTIQEALTSKMKKKPATKY